jgi:leucyl-tRNA synthetase
VYRYLQRTWRLVVDEESGEPRVGDEAMADDTRRVLHKTIAGVRADMEGLRFNTAIAKLTELVNHLTSAARATTPREAAETLVLMLAPLAPHIAEELWHRLGHTEWVGLADFPAFDPALIVDESIVIPVQVNGKVKARITVSADADAAALEATARADVEVLSALAGAAVRRAIVVPGRLVNLITG